MPVEGLRCSIFQIMITTRYEAELIKIVVTSVGRGLQEDLQLDMPEELYGDDDHSKKIMNRIDSPSNNGRRMGIYDMVGRGMTALAKCIDNPLLNKFAHVRFLPDVLLGLLLNIRRIQHRRESEKIANSWKNPPAIAWIAGLILLLICAFLVSFCFFPNHPEMEKKSAENESTEGRFDIFLSFRGPDTRKEFTDHLYRGLVKAGTIVFRDDRSIRFGKKFGPEILSAITRSKIWIPIISENYASSEWCLCELIHIMDWTKNTDMSDSVLPIFYKVKPSDVRHLKGSFGKAFDSRKEDFDKKVIKEGPEALTEVSNLQGFVSKDISNGYEGALVEEVIKEVLSKLQHDFQRDVTKHPVGIGDHVHTIKNRVDTPASDVRMIRIWGMGGLVKLLLPRPSTTSCRMTLFIEVQIFEIQLTATYSLCAKSSD